MSKQFDKSKIPVVVNRYKSDYDVYIGRGSKWGNPFVISKNQDRDTVVAKYREHLHASPELMAALPELIGKRLGCYCKPQLCHGDVLAEEVEQLLVDYYETST